MRVRHRASVGDSTELGLASASLTDADTKPLDEDVWSGSLPVAKLAALDHADAGDRIVIFARAKVVSLSDVPGIAV